MLDTVSVFQRNACKIDIFRIFWHQHIPAPHIWGMVQNRRWVFAATSKSGDCGFWDFWSYNFWFCFESSHMSVYKLGYYWEEDVVGFWHSENCQTFLMWESKAMFSDCVIVEVARLYMELQNCERKPSFYGPETSFSGVLTLGRFWLFLDVCLFSRCLSSWP